MAQRICPYPGLRTFTEEQSIYFKGREENIKKAIALLQKNKFLMLTGSSGDGKSSMVYAGIIPQARAGIFSGEFPNWLVLDFKPQRNPIKSLVQVLHDELIPNVSLEIIEQRLNLGFSALVDLYLESESYFNQQELQNNGTSEEEIKKKKRKARNILLIVDQFEELFTNPENFKDGIPSRESKLLLNLIQESNRIALEKNIPLYIACTMRSDYYSYCNSFGGFPELMGKSQYFIPRLTRSDVHRAIEDPAVLSGNKIEARLIERLLYEVKEGADILPVLQHALFRIFNEYEKDEAETMDLIHFAKVGGMPANELDELSQKKFNDWYSTQFPSRINNLVNPSLANVLNAHANELSYASPFAYNLSHPDNPISDEITHKIIKTAFMGMTHIDGGKAVRNRISVNQIKELLNVDSISEYTIFEMLKIFALEENSLVRTFSEDEQNKDSGKIVFDITHEALIRNWKFLQELINEEQENILVLNDLISQVLKWAKGNKSKDFLLPEGQFAFFNTWLNEVNVTSALIKNIAKPEIIGKNNPEEINKLINEFILENSKAVNRKKRILKTSLITVSIACLFAIVGFYWASKQSVIANTLYKDARSSELAMHSFQQNNGNPTLALRLAEEAYKISATPLSKEALMSSFIKGPFYKKILKSHNGISRWCEYSPKENFIITKSEDLTIKIWTKQGDLYSTIEGHRDLNFQYDVSQNEELIVSQPSYNSLYLWRFNGIMVAKIQLNDSISDFKFSKANNNIILTTITGQLKTFNPKGQEILSARIPNTKLISFTEIANENRILVSGYNSLYNWDLSDNTVKKITTKNATFTNVKYLSNNRFITYGIGNKITVWKNNILQNEIKLNCKEIPFIKISPSKQFVVGRTNEGTGFILKMDDFSFIELDKKLSANIYFINTNSSGTKIYTCSDDQTIKVWTLKGSLIKTINLFSEAYCVNFSKDEKFMLSSHNSGDCTIWKNEKQISETLIGHSNLIWEIATSKSGKYLASASWDGSVRIWDNFTGDCINHYYIGEKMQYATFSNDESCVVATGEKGTVAILSILTHDLITNNHFNTKVLKAELLPESMNFVVPTADGKIGIYDRNGVLIKVLNQHKSRVAQIIILKNGNYISNSYDKTSILWNNENKLIKIISGHTSPIYTSTLSTNQEFFATASLDGSLILWNINGGKIHEIKTGTRFGGAMQFNHKGDQIAFGTIEGRLGIWNIKANTFKLYHKHMLMINTVAYSDDDKYILTSSDDETAKLSDAYGNDIATYKGAMGAIQFASFSYDRTSVITAGQDGVIRKWPIFVDNILEWVKKQERSTDLYKLTEVEKEKYNITSD